MLSSTAIVLGGIGLFLVGMRLLSDGLEAAAGSGLRRGLQRAASTRWKAFVSGALLTALVQSSSATTIATIGFVSAGLLTVGQSLGVIIGANVGTTSTGWLVSLAGFKVSLGTWMLPMVGVGALFHLVSKSQKRHLGLALAGFGMIFVGIDFLQDGMGGLAAHIDFSAYSAATWSGRLLLVLAGLLITALVQSSSVAVALSLTALGSGAIDMTQAAYLVIGQNLGTTVTAVLASLGATVPARRTAIGHILFNLMAGAIAFGAAPWFLQFVNYLLAAGAPDVIRIALFHTLFNIAGALIALPAVGLLARAVQHLVPEPVPTLTRHLDKSLLQVPPAALDASAHVVRRVAAIVYRRAARLADARGTASGAGKASTPKELPLSELTASLGTTLDFMARTGNVGEIPRDRTNLAHASDHLARLVKALGDTAATPPTDDRKPDEPAATLATMLGAAADRLDAADRVETEVADHLEKVSKDLASWRARERTRLLADLSVGQRPVMDADRELGRIAWLDRVGYHAWRAASHLAAWDHPNSTTAAE